MQFANDITPLTLASTAELLTRERMGDGFPTLLRGIRAELQSRIPGESLPDKNDEIKDLEEQLETMKEERDDADSDLRESNGKLIEIQTLIDAGDFEPKEIRDIILR